MRRRSRQKSLEIDNVLGFPLGDLDLRLRGARTLVLDRNGVLLARPGDRDSVLARDSSITGLEGGQLEGPIRLDIAISFPTAVGFKENLSPGQRLALVRNLPLDRDSFADIRARVGAAAPAGREQNDGQNEPTGAVRIKSLRVKLENPASRARPGLRVS